MATFTHLKEGSPEWALATMFKTHPPKKPLIAAISGGSDSMTLYHLLQWMKRHIPLKVIVAHVNHGVRKESAQEELDLKELVEKNGDLFQVKKLKPIKSNFENRARNERLNFFYSLYKQHDAECCLLAHHADDVAESVIKRIFEGSSYEMLKSMEPISAYQGMPLWRPFLSISKKELDKFPHFTDETNFTGHNLRAKMRRSIIPFLEEQFGKNIQPTLCRLAKDAARFSEYLDTLFPKLETSFDRISLHPFLLKHFLHRWLNHNGLIASNDQLEKLNEAILSKKSGQAFLIGGRKIKVGRQKVSIELV